MLDLSTPGLAPLPVVARRLLPEAPAPSTLVRWHRRGVGDPKIRLATIKIGRKVYTTDDAMRRFLARLNEQDQSPAGPAADPDRHARTDAKLREAGVLA